MYSVEVKNNEKDFLNDLELRNRVIGRIEVLEKTKTLITYNGTDLFDFSFASDYYEVDCETIRKIYQRNKDEFESDGCRKYINKEVKELMGQVVPTNHNVVPTKRVPNVITLMTKRGLLRMGMLLADSEVAKEIRTQLLNGFDNSVNNGQIQNFTQDIDEEKRLLFNVGMAMAEGDMDKFTKANFELNEFRQRKIKGLEGKIEELGDKIGELEEENKKLRIFVNGMKEFTKTELAEKLDTSTQFMGRFFKALGVYTPVNNELSEKFKQKFPNIKMFTYVKNKFFGEKPKSAPEYDWQWTEAGAYEIINYLIKMGFVIETDNGGFKLDKESARRYMKNKNKK